MSSFKIGDGIDCSPYEVGDYINTMKTTFDLNFDLHQAFKLHEYTKKRKQREAISIKKASL